MSDLSKFSDKELKKEISRREEEKRAVKVALLRRHHEIVLNNIHVVLALVPEHDRTSCSDDDRGNEKRCVRCALLAIQSQGWVPDRLRVSVAVSFEPEEV